MPTDSISDIPSDSKWILPWPWHLEGSLFLGFLDAGASLFPCFGYYFGETLIQSLLCTWFHLLAWKLWWYVLSLSLKSTHFTRCQVDFWTALSQAPFFINLVGKVELLHLLKCWLIARTEAGGPSYIQVAHIRAGTTSRHNLLSGGAAAENWIRGGEPRAWTHSEMKSSHPRVPKACLLPPPTVTSNVEIRFF